MVFAGFVANALAVVGFAALDYQLKEAHDKHVKEFGALKDRCDVQESMSASGMLEDIQKTLDSHMKDLGALKNRSDAFLEFALAGSEDQRTKRFN